MKKYRVYVPVRFEVEVEVVAVDETDALDIVQDMLTVEEYANETVGASLYGENKYEDYDDPEIICVSNAEVDDNGFEPYIEKVEDIDDFDPDEEVEEEEE